MICAGIALIIIALAIFAADRISENKNAEDVADAAGFLAGLIPERTPGVIGESSNPVMPTVGYEGRDYAALFECDRFGVSLPVCARWDEKTAEKVPCIFCGSASDGGLVIGGSDRKGQLDFMERIDVGDTFRVTDLYGREYGYKTIKVLHKDNAERETIIDEEYDLTFFARMGIGKDYIVVRCNIE